MRLTAYYSLPSSHHAKQISKRTCSACFFNPKCKALSSSSSSLPLQCSNNILRGLGVVRIKAKQQRGFGPIYASKPETPPTDVSQKWLLEPVGDGDTRHIGFKVPMPNAYEITSNEVTVGRLPEKADLVIPVATVSGVHARIQKKEENLLVTDLGSTNGTFIDDKKLRPGVVSAAPPGSYLTFGDEHLAVFRISKLENAETASTPDPSEDTVETEIPTESVMTS